MSEKGRGRMSNCCRIDFWLLVLFLGQTVNLNSLMSSPLSYQFSRLVEPDRADFNCHTDYQLVWTGLGWAGLEVRKSRSFSALSDPDSPLNLLSSDWFCGENFVTGIVADLIGETFLRD